MEKIKIDEAHREAIAQAVTNAQKRARARTISTEDVYNAVGKIERRLNEANCRFEGVSAKVDLNAQRFAKSYMGSPMSTVFWIEHSSSGWFLTEVKRYFCDNYFSFRLTLPEHTEQEAIDWLGRFN